MRRRLILVAAMPLLSGIVVLGTASGASADPPETASCVARAVHTWPGPPGRFQSEQHLERFGQIVSLVAHYPQDVCTQMLSNPRT